MEFLDSLVGECFQVEIYKNGIAISRKGYYLEQVMMRTTWHSEVFKYPTYVEAMMALGQYMVKMEEAESKPKMSPTKAYRPPKDAPVKSKRPKRGRPKTR